MFVTFEGIDGSGKTSVMAHIAAQLQKEGKSVLVTREPGGSSLGEKIRSIVLSAKTQNLAPRAELFLFLADRAQHVENLIKPELAKGTIILCDRYTDSTRAYQGAGRGIESNLLENLLCAATCGLEPHATILLDLPAELGLKRANARNAANGTAVTEGRFDSYTLAFHENVRNRYLALAKEYPERIHTVDASADFSCVVRTVFNILNELLP